MRNWSWGIQTVCWVLQKTVCLQSGSVLLFWGEMNSLCHREAHENKHRKVLHDYLGEKYTQSLHTWRHLLKRNTEKCIWCGGLLVHEQNSHSTALGQHLQWKERLQLFRKGGRKCMRGIYGPWCECRMGVRLERCGEGGWPTDWEQTVSKECFSAQTWSQPCGQHMSNWMTAQPAVPAKPGHSRDLWAAVGAWEGAVTNTCSSFHFGLLFAQHMGWIDPFSVISDALAQISPRTAFLHMQMWALGVRALPALPVVFQTLFAACHICLMSLSQGQVSVNPW